MRYNYKIAVVLVFAIMSISTGVAFADDKLKAPMASLGLRHVSWPRPDLQTIAKEIRRLRMATIALPPQTTSRVAILSMATERVVYREHS